MGNWIDINKKFFRNRWRAITGIDGELLAIHFKIIYVRCRVIGDAEFIKAFF